MPEGLRSRQLAQLTRTHPTWHTHRERPERGDQSGLLIPTRDDIHSPPMSPITEPSEDWVFIESLQSDRNILLSNEMLTLPCFSSGIIETVRTLSR